MRKLAIVSLIVLLCFAAIGMAQTFYFIFNQTGYKPTQYSWTEFWEVKEVADFMEATLTLTGSGYVGESHDVSLILKNAVTEPDYIITGMDYSATWFVDPDSEVIIEGSYLGALVAGETVEYTGSFTPTLVGTGDIQMSIVNIVWAQPEPITWSYETDTTGTGGKGVIHDLIVIGAAQTLIESGTVEFTLENLFAPGYTTFGYKIEIVELGEIVAEGEVKISEHSSELLSFSFDPLAVGGTYTMKVTVWEII